MRTWLYVIMEHVLTENPAVSDRFVLPDIVAACSASLAVVPRLSHGGRLLSLAARFVFGRFHYGVFHGINDKRDYPIRRS